MLRHRSLFTCLLTLTAASLACGDNTADGGNDTANDGGTASETADGSEASGTMSSTGPGDGDGDTGDGDPGDGDGDTGDGDTGDGDGDGDTGDGDGDTGDGDGDGDTGDGDGDTGDGDGDGDQCEVAEIACDGLDEDCNGIIDDLDEGMDGFCDCYRIGIIGNKGANPAADFEAWLESKGTTATRFGTMVNHVLTVDDLAEIDILIVDRLTHQYSPQEAAILQAWIAAGHGLISMAGYTNNPTDVAQQNSLVTIPTGLSYAAPIYIDPTEVWQNHPVAEGAQGVQIYGGWQVVGAGMVFVRPQGENNTSLGTAVELTDGAAIVFADEWISFDSEWQQIPQVEVFWQNMISWVGPKTFCADPQ
ncbi:hypothetical protein DB30_05059 [Enhygromyxa salina]|uniref:Uncharacterized protein n=1 Tax=Enhygromyxa salina TaxID=215803 RepID=A0A0C2D2L0_9BACT|nr:hypothetical protein [Enhygromyxa salina]KIG16005.1 hypothetical protein DB30_05059 [Enhygromyxa salina]